MNRLNILDLEDFAKRLKHEGIERAYFTYGFVSDEKNDEIQLSVILEAKFNDVIVKYREVIGTEKNTKEKRKELMDKSSIRRTEISEVLLDYGIGMSEGYYD